MTSPAFPTLTPPFANFPINIDEDWGMVVTDMESGHQETRSRWSKPRRMFTWHAPALSLANARIVQAFLRDRKGGGDIFYINNTEYVVQPYDGPTLSQAAGGNLGARKIGRAHV